MNEDDISTAEFRQNHLSELVNQDCYELISEHNLEEEFKEAVIKEHLHQQDIEVRKAGYIPVESMDPNHGYDDDQFRLLNYCADLEVRIKKLRNEKIYFSLFSFLTFLAIFLTLTLSQASCQNQKKNIPNTETNRKR